MTNKLLITDHMNKGYNCSVFKYNNINWYHVPYVT